MTDKKEGPSGPGRSTPEAAGGKRPFATLDLKATEVRSEPAKSMSENAKAGSVAGPAAPEATSQQAQAAEKIAAASAALPKDKAAGTARPAAGPASDDTRSKGSSNSPASAAARVASTAPGTSGESSLGRVLSHLAAGVAGGALALLAAYQLDALGNSGNGQHGMSPEIIGRLTALERSMRERLASGNSAEATAKLQQSLDTGLKKIDGLAKQVAGLEESQGKLASDAGALREQQTKLQAGTAPEERIAKLEEQLASMRSAAEADPQRAGRLPQLAQLTGKITDLESQIAARLDRLRKDVTQEVDSRMVAAAEASETAKSGTTRLDREVVDIKSETTRLGQRLDQLKAGSDKLDQGVKELGDAAAALKASLDKYKTEIESEMKAMARPADIARAITPIGDKVAAIESGMQGIVKAEEDRRTNAERIVLSLELGNLKRAMERGSRYESELAEVKRIAGARLDLSALERYQSTGVLTTVDLARAFRPVANAMMDIDATPENASTVDKLLSGAKTIVRVRRTTHADNDNSTEAIIGRMEVALKEGRLADVLAESKKLSPRVAAPAQDWLHKVEARQVVDATLAGIDTALKSSLGGAPGASSKGAKQ